MVEKEKEAIIIWLYNNHGILAKIARDLRPPVTPQYVGMVARGKRRSKDGVIERKLRALGCPLY